MPTRNFRWILAHLIPNKRPIPSQMNYVNKMLENPDWSDIGIATDTFNLRSTINNSNSFIMVVTSDQTISVFFVFPPRVEQIGLLSKGMRIQAQITLTHNFCRHSHLKEVLRVLYIYIRNIQSQSAFCSYSGVCNAVAVK